VASVSHPSPETEARTLLGLSTLLQPGKHPLGAEDLVSEREPEQPSRDPRDELRRRRSMRQ
jgi:hypothetical protein